MKRAFPVMDERGVQHTGLSRLEYHASHMMLVLIPLHPEWPYCKIAEHAVEAAKELIGEVDSQ